ncbi:MAG: 4Fe-4S dicluster domain-containing protein [Acidobacteriota bacterium]
MTFKLRKDLGSHTTFAYRNPPLSGNSINGLGEKEWRPARHVFHNDGSEVLPWDRLDRIFAYVNPWQVVLWMMRNMWTLRKASGPTAAIQQPVEKPQAMTREIKRRARALGADLVGVTTLKPEYLFEGRQVPYRYVISVGVAMNRKRMEGVPDTTAAREVMRAYARVGHVVSILSQEIRAMGWPARGYGNPNSGDLLHIPIAIDCGLGQLGKHGSLISREEGSNFRLGCVVTDLPLALLDQPVDIGVDDLCSRCTICVRQCPVDAIYAEKMTVRGVTKWYVDFDKCVPYFCETAGCGICIEVCPWSEEGRGPRLSERLLSTRRRLARTGPQS